MYFAAGKSPKAPHAGANRLAAVICLSAVFALFARDTLRSKSRPLSTLISGK